VMSEVPEESLGYIPSPTLLEDSTTLNFSGPIKSGSVSFSFNERYRFYVVNFLSITGSFTKAGTPGEAEVNFSLLKNGIKLMSLTNNYSWVAFNSENITIAYDFPIAEAPLYFEKGDTLSVSVSVSNDEEFDSINLTNIQLSGLKRE